MFPGETRLSGHAAQGAQVQNKCLCHAQLGVFSTGSALLLSELKHVIPITNPLLIHTPAQECTKQRKLCVLCFRNYCLLGPS
jgi:hypothetical protein